MKQEIENELSPLIGLPFWQARRVVNLVLFGFGNRIPSINKKGKRFEYGEYQLHISCQWRFTHLDEIVVGSRDIVYPPDGSANPPDDFDWDTENGNLYDVRMDAFLKEHANKSITVSSIEAGRVGYVSIFFNDNYVLDIFPSHSASENNYVEHWRFLKVNGDHFVFTSDGIERSAHED